MHVDGQSNGFAFPLIVPTLSTVCRECGVNRFIATGLHLQLLCEMETLSNDLFHGPRTVAPWT